jgi:hypothetical protein
MRKKREVLIGSNSPSGLFFYALHLLTKREDRDGTQL